MYVPSVDKDVETYLYLHTFSQAGGFVRRKLRRVGAPSPRTPPPRLLQLRGLMGLSMM